MKDRRTPRGGSRNLTREALASVDPNDNGTNNETDFNREDNDTMNTTDTNHSVDYNDVDTPAEKAWAAALLEMNRIAAAATADDLLAAWQIIFAIDYRNRGGECLAFDGQGIRVRTDAERQIVDELQHYHRSTVARTALRVSELLARFELTSGPQLGGVVPFLGPCTESTHAALDELDKKLAPDGDSTAFLENIRDARSTYADTIAEGIDNYIHRGQ